MTLSWHSGGSLLHGNADEVLARPWQPVVKDAIALHDVGAAIRILQARQLSIGSGLVLWGVVRQTLEGSRYPFAALQQELSAAHKHQHSV